MFLPFCEYHVFTFLWFFVYSVLPFCEFHVCYLFVNFICVTFLWILRMLPFCEFHMRYLFVNLMCVTFLWIGSAKWVESWTIGGKWKEKFIRACSSHLHWFKSFLIWSSHLDLNDYNFYFDPVTFMLIWIVFLFWSSHLACFQNIGGFYNLHTV